VLVAAPSAARGAEPECLGETVEATAAEVIDTRTLRLDDGRMLRLAGVEPFTLLLPDAENAEEMVQRRLTDLLAGVAPRVLLVSDKPDRHGRLPALIAAGGSLVEETLVKEGLAIAFAGGDALPCFDRILAAEAEARRAHRGFWAQASVAEARPGALGSRIGRFTIFEGTVLSASNRRATTYLDFGRRWSEDVTIEIAAKDRKAFGGEPVLARLAGSRIRARGYLEEKGGPMLPVRSPMQIEILSPATGVGQNAP